MRTCVFPRVFIYLFIYFHPIGVLQISITGMTSWPASLPGVVGSWFPHVGILEGGGSQRTGTDLCVDFR